MVKSPPVETVAELLFAAISPSTSILWVFVLISSVPEKSAARAEIAFTGKNALDKTKAKPSAAPFKSPLNFDLDLVIYNLSNYIINLVTTYFKLFFVLSQQKKASIEKYFILKCIFIRQIAKTGLICSYVRANKGFFSGSRL